MQQSHNVRDFRVQVTELLHLNCRRTMIYERYLKVGNVFSERKKQESLNRGRLFYIISPSEELPQVQSYHTSWSYHFLWFWGGDIGGPFCLLFKVDFTKA